MRRSKRVNAGPERGPSRAPSVQGAGGTRSARLLGAAVIAGALLGATGEAVAAPGTTSPRPWIDDRLAQEQTAYAGFVQDHPPDGYPYRTQVIDAWRAWLAQPEDDPHPVYSTVTLTGWSIATLTHGAYEAGVGRFSESLAHGRLTPEDAWEARTAVLEARYRKAVSWYRFPVWGALHDLWTSDAPTDVSFPRQLERRYAYTSAYVLQGVAAAITGLIVGDGL